MRRLISTLVLVGVATASLAASVTTETFNAGANGWVGTVNLAGAWGFSAGVAGVTFSDTGFPLPDEAKLSSSPAATSGSFTGNFVAAGIEAIGIRFQAVDALPSDVQFLLSGGTSVYRRSFLSSVVQTGTWYTLVASLADAQLGGWTNLSGTLHEFHDSLTDVKGVTVRIARSGQAQQTYLIDEIFLDHLPAGAEFVFAEDEVSVRWTGLRPSVMYGIESTTNLISSPWQHLDQFIATAVQQILALPKTNTAQFLRITIP